MRGSEHRGRGVEFAGREVDEIGRDEAEVDYVDAAAPDTFGEGSGELDARWPHVATDEQPRRMGEPGEGDSDGGRDPGVELVGHGATDVVCLEDGVERGHAARSLPGGV